MNKSFVLRSLPVLALVALVSACGGDEPGVVVEEGGPKTGGGPKPVLSTPTPVATPEEFDEYTYNPIGKRDPFKSFLAEEIAPGQQKIVTPLQRFDIDQLGLIGIIWGISTPRAMVVTPDGKGYVVQKGTLVGKNWGKVSRITQDEVIISEEFRDFEGKLIVHEIPLKMPKSDSEVLE